MEITMVGANIKIGTNANGDRAVVADDEKSGIRVIIPLTAEGARIVAEALNNVIVIAKEIPLRAVKQ
jgi:hypothetical protein